MVTNKINVGWKVATLNIDVASLRYRALYPILALKEHDINNKIFASTNSSHLKGIDALVIVKSFTLDDYWLTQEAVKLRIPVVFDLCDNIFIGDYTHKTSNNNAAEVFLLIARLASAIVVTTEPLASITREAVGPDVPIHIIPDGIETQSLIMEARSYTLIPRYMAITKKLLMPSRIARAFSHITNRLSIFKTASFHGILHWIVNDLASLYRKLRRLLPGHGLLKKLYRIYDNWRSILTGRPRKLPPTPSSIIMNDKAQSPAEHKSPPVQAPANHKKILWFGNHGAPHADFGMTDLLIIRKELESIASKLPVELIVISNNVNKYLKHIRPLAIPSRYVEWSAKTVAEHLLKADVVIIPNSLDSFSICKSSNRSVLALSHGAPVVATATPALEALRECIYLNDFETGLWVYLTDPVFAKQQVRRGQEAIKRLYGQEIIGQSWSRLINGMIRSNHRHDIQNPDVILAIHLPQDIELAEPVLAAAQQRGLDCSVWTSLSALQRWPQLAGWIRTIGFDYQILPDDLKELKGNLFPKGSSALLSVTESNLGPHRFTHRLTKAANVAGIYTATMQHGYENVGLSYTDDVHYIKRVRFLSRRIYTWGPLSTLHPEITHQTQRKCFPVGCPKKMEPEKTGITYPWNQDVPAIGVFENLHWHRYSEEYRSFFIDSVEQLADKFPGLTFIIKPHNAGLWLTNRYRGDAPKKENIIIIDPKEPKWSRITARHLFDQLAAVITTPSTVALDSARLGVPTAVVAYDLTLNNYAPLPLLYSVDNWAEFIINALNNDARTELQDYTKQFADRVVLAGDAAKRIVDDLMLHIKPAGRANA